MWISAAEKESYIEEEEKKFICQVGEDLETWRPLLPRYHDVFMRLDCGWAAGLPIWIRT